MERIFVINPGSTSTKIALFEEEKRVWSKNLQHPYEIIEKFEWITDEVDYRRSCILEALAADGVDIRSFTCVMARGGQLPPVLSGAYAINQDMVDCMYSIKEGAHVSNIACIIADGFSKQVGIPAYIYDAVTVDELSPVARITGMPLVPKVSRAHTLNALAMAKRCAKDILKKPYEECTFIVLHIGGGCTTKLIHKGRSIDQYGDDEAEFSPERCGRIQAMELIRFCFSGKYTFAEVAKLLRGNAGLRAWLGTADSKEIEARIEAGDEKARLIYEAFMYGMAKSIGDLATVVKGKLDRIILTGGIARSKMVTDYIIDHVGWIAPVEVMAGEYEMEALAEGGLRVMRGEEKAHTFVWNKNPQR